MNLDFHTLQRIPKPASAAPFHQQVGVQHQQIPIHLRSDSFGTPIEFALGNPANAVHTMSADLYSRQAVRGMAECPDRLPSDWAAAVETFGLDFSFHDTLLLQVFVFVNMVALSFLRDE